MEFVKAGLKETRDLGYCLFGCYLSRPEHTWISYTTDVLGGCVATNTVYVQKPLKEVVFPKEHIQQPR